MPTPNANDVDEFEVDSDDQNVESNDELDDDTLDDTDVDETEDNDDTDEDDTEDDSDKKDDTEDGKFEKRYTQLKGDTPEEYAKSLEEAYNNSSAEGVRLGKEMKDLKSKVAGIIAAAEKDPALAKQLGLTSEDGQPQSDPTAPKSPAETYAEQLMNERMEQEYKDFTKLHPEIDTDATMSENLLAEVGAQSAAYNQRTGKIISMAEALSRSWKVLGYDDNSKENLAVKAKETASQGTARGTSTKKSGTKTEVSDKALEYAKKMGLSEKDVKTFYKP